MKKWLSFLGIFIFLVVSLSGVSMSDHKVIINGVQLTVKSKSIIETNYNHKKFVFDGSSGVSNVYGVRNNACKLEVIYYEYEKGDATFYIKNGVLSYKTKSGKPACAIGVSGALPNHVSVHFDVGSGDVKISNFSKSDKIKIDSGSGNVVINNCDAIESIVVDIGSGDVRLDNINDVSDIVVDGGSGQTSIKNSDKVNSIRVDSGSGSLKLKNSKCKVLDFDSGSGSARLVDSKIDFLKTDTGSGSVFINKSEIILNKIEAINGIMKLKRSPL